MKESFMAPKKILYLITKSNWGGAQRYVYDLAVAAKERGLTVVVATGGTGELAKRLTQSGIRVVSLPLVQRKTFIADMFALRALFALVRIIKKEHPDVVHANSAKAGGLGGLAARLCGVPRIVFTAHGWEFNAPRSALSKIGIRFFSWLTIILSHITIAVSEAVAHDTRSWPLVRNRVVVIRNGITCPHLLPRAKARALLAPDISSRVWVGMVSELQPTKRIEDAIDAFSHVARAHSDAVLVIVGEGQLRSALSARVGELHLEKRVLLVGFRSDAASLLSAFDVFLHSSASEALGYVVLEAGCAGLPVVATSVGGIPEVIPDAAHGMLVPPKDPAAIARALDRLLVRPQERKALGIALQKRVAEKFSTSAMMEGTFFVY